MNIRWPSPMSPSRLKRRARHGLLGENILGSGFSFDIKINRGGGAFVCGESSALFASIEGRAGEPRAKYVHATDQGLYNKPTILNNVETWGNVPLIINRGADWYASDRHREQQGHENLLARRQDQQYGPGGSAHGHHAAGDRLSISAAASPRDGNSRPCRPAGPRAAASPRQLLDMPVDFDELTKIGSMMGSGGMIVMDDRNCMVDVAKYFLKFLEEESCGKCTPCREGVLQMRIILDRITEGNGEESDIETLEWMGAGHHRRLPVRARRLGPQPGAHHDQIFPRRVRGPYPRQKMPGGRLQAAYHLFGRRPKNAPAAMPAPVFARPKRRPGRRRRSIRSTGKRASSAAPATTPASSMRYR